MTQPGSPASAMPLDESSVMRRLADLERQIKELGPSVAGSFNSTIEQLEQTLANQAVPAAYHTDSGGFGLSSSYSALAFLSVPVPAGYTRAVVMAVTNVSVRNSLGERVGVWAQVDINGTALARLAQAGVDSQNYGMVSSQAAAVLTGLSGSFYIQTLARTAISSFAASGSNAVNLDASVLFLR